MKTKTIELYEYDELPEDVQEKVLEHERYINVEFGDWHDYDGKTGFTSKELSRMRLSPSAPDIDELITWKNLWFDIDRGWYIQFTDAEFTHDETARRFLRVPKELWARVDWVIVNHGREGTTALEYESQDCEGFTLKQTEILDRAVELFSDKMHEALKGLRDSYEYLLSDEAVIDTIRANEYTFTASGKMEDL